MKIREIGVVKNAPSAPAGCMDRVERALNLYHCGDYNGFTLYLFLYEPL
jgi:hypothetical protein